MRILGKKIPAKSVAPGGSNQSPTIQRDSVLFVEKSPREWMDEKITEVGTRLGPGADLSAGARDLSAGARFEKHGVERQVGRVAVRTVSALG